MDAYYRLKLDRDDLSITSCYIKRMYVLFMCHLRRSGMCMTARDRDAKAPCCYP